MASISTTALASAQTCGHEDTDEMNGCWPHRNRCNSDPGSVGLHEMFEVTEISSEDRILYRIGDQTFEGCAQDRVQQPLVVPEVEQLEEVPKTVSERPGSLSSRSKLL